MPVLTRWITSLSLALLVAIPGFSASTFPRGCEVVGFGFNDHYLVLNERDDQQAIYLLQNRSSQGIELEQVPTKDVFMSPKLHSKLDPLNWSGFASDTTHLHFKCFKQNDDNTVTTLQCSEVLDVCQYPRAKFPLSSMGTYWVSTNKDQAQVIKDATAKGLYLRW